MAKGKYAGVIDKLPRSFGTEPEYQQKVSAVKKQIAENRTNARLDTDTILSWSGDIHKELIEFEKLLLLATGGKIHGSELARVYRDLRAVKDMLEGHVSNVNLLIESHAQMMAEQFEVEGTKSLTLDDAKGGTVRVQWEPQAKVVDRDAFRQWCLDEGLERQLMLPWQTTNMLTKQRLLDGEAEPPGVTAEARAKFVYTKG
jgi:hypothetical protein